MNCLFRDKRERKKLLETSRVGERRERGEVVHQSGESQERGEELHSYSGIYSYTTVSEFPQSPCGSMRVFTMSTRVFWGDRRVERGIVGSVVSGASSSITTAGAISLKPSKGAFSLMPWGTEWA